MLIVNSIWYYIKVMFAFLTYPVRRTYKANICGHKTKLWGMTRTPDDYYLMRMLLAENGNPDYCHCCIGKMSILCAWCSNPINIGDPITLYGPNPMEEWIPPERAFRYKEDPAIYVGCLRWGCASCAADRAGFWMPPGQVKKVMSPIEMLANSDANAEGIIVLDLHDQNNLGTVVPAPRSSV